MLTVGTLILDSYDTVSPCITMPEPASGCLLLQGRSRAAGSALQRARAGLNDSAARQAAGRGPAVPLADLPGQGMGARARHMIFTV